MKKLLVFLITLLMIFCSAFATTINGEQGAFTTPDTPVIQEKILQLEKELRAYNVNESTIYAPTITYTYSIEATSIVTGTTVTDSANKHESDESVTMAVKAGVHADQITISDVSWTTSDTLNASTDGTPNIKLINIDFSNVVFEGAGIYRYTLTEELASGFTYTNTGITENTDASNKHTRFIDLYVKPSATNYTDGLTAEQWDIYGYVCIHNNDSITDGNKNTVAYKTTGFVDVNSTYADQYYTYNLTIGKIVENDNYNKANHQFPFTIIFSNSDITHDILLDTNITGTVTDFARDVGAPTWSGITKIKDSSTIKYIGIPVGTSIEVYETNDAEGVTYQVTTNHTYEVVDSSVPSTSTPTSAVAQNSPKSEYQSTKTDIITVKDVDDDNIHTITVTNRLVVISPTGIVLRTAPYAIMLGAGAAMFAIVHKKKKEDK